MTDLTEVPVYVINLAGSDIRLRSAQDQLRVAGVRFQRIEAVDGRGRDVGELPGYDESAAVRFFGRGLTSGEVGCYLSHVAAAEALVQSGAPAGLIFEDDFVALPGAWDTVSQALGALTRQANNYWELVNLARAPRLVTGDFSALSDQRRLMHAYYFPVVATAMLWSRAGAQRFLREASAPVAPVDHMYRRLMSQSGCGFALDQPIFSILGADSDIALASGKPVPSKQTTFGATVRKKGGEVRRQLVAVFGALRRKWSP